MEGENQDLANKCHPMAARLHTDIMVLVDQEDLLEVMVDIQVRHMEDLTMLLLALTLGILDLVDSSIMFLGNKAVLDGTLILAAHLHPHKEV